MFREFNTRVAFLIMSLLVAACNASSQPQERIEDPDSLPAPDSPALADSVIVSVTDADTSAADPPPGHLTVDFSSETIGAEPTSFIPTVGYWMIGVDGDNAVLMVDGSKWSQGESSRNIAEQARALYGDRYAEFLDNVQAYAYYPFAVAKDVDNFTNGEITLRFKILAGNIDQNAGILFGLQPNGDYYTIRASTLEDNLVLWQVVRGNRSSLEWIRDTHTTAGEWHELKVVINDTVVEGYIDGELYLTHTFDTPPGGKIGVWSKSDSVAYFDDFTETESP